MRVDRAITLGLVHPVHRVWRRLASSARAPQLPVLMYHSISGTSEPDVSAYYRVCTSPGRFAEHMAFLAAKGWRGVTLSEGLASLRPSLLPSTLSPSSSDLQLPTSTGASPSPSSSDLKLQLSTSTRAKRVVAITFDDGFRDFYTEAFPILQSHGFSATMYLPTGYIGTARRSFKQRECLTWPEIGEMQAAGVEFGSHTVNHPKLVELASDEVVRELHDSKQAIEQALQRPVTTFAYPFAFPQANVPFVETLRAVLIENGYTSCVTTAIGRVTRSTDLLQLPRLPANSADDCGLLNAKLSGAYDWMALPQILRKRSAARSRRVPSELPPAVRQ